MGAEEYERHALALAGYALAIEADEEVPVDAGLLISPSTAA